MARVRRFDEELRFLDDSMSPIVLILVGRRVVASEEIFRELIAGIAITENACVVESPAKLIHDGIRVILHVERLCFD